MRQPRQLLNRVSTVPCPWEWRGCCSSAAARKHSSQNGSGSMTHYPKSCIVDRVRKRGRHISIRSRVLWLRWSWQWYVQRELWLVPLPPFASLNSAMPASNNGNYLHCNFLALRSNDAKLDVQIG